MATLDKLEGLNRKLTVAVPKDKVDAEFNQAYMGIRQRVEVPGFRKGKAPMDKIKSMYGDKVKQDVIQRLVSEAYSMALEEHKTEPISMPKIDFAIIEEGKDFEFTAEFEIRPEVNLKKYEGLKIQKEKLEVGQEQVDQVIENMLKSKSELTPVLEDRPAKEGDTSKIDFDGSIDSKPLDGGQATDFDLELGTNSFIPGFEEGIVGMKIGQTKDLHLKFPEEYHAKEIAGKDVVFKVTLKGLSKKTLPEMNDEFAKSIGAEFDTVAALKDRILKDIEEGEAQRIEEELKNRVLKALVKANPVEVPISLLDEQKQKLIQDTQQRMQQQGMGPEHFEEYKVKWDADFSKTASYMIQSSFLVDALARELDIKATAKDVEDKLQQHANQSGIDLEQLKEFYKTPERRSQLSFQITEDRVIQTLVEKAEVSLVSKDKIEKED